MDKTKPLQISKHAVWAAYRKGESQQGCGGRGRAVAPQFEQDPQATYPAVEPDVVGVLLPAGQAGKERREGRWSRPLGVSTVSAYATSSRSCLGSDLIVVTHPFPSHSGQRLRSLFERRLVSGRLLVCDDGESGTVTVGGAWVEGCSPLACGSPPWS